ncbi:hypothetical protein JG687_00015273 [Phytophthora cactorum]|uniref:Uncharacterized protein n=1 Tax=Phytophthora cactorum TaxID=29920 RepID=A0A8T1TU64_9STRA|nr:hypothetical protein JG687_00015273 [Phytophthora cactorum]
MTKGKRAGDICTFPQCNKTMTTSKFKQHFQQHLLEGEAYDITHRERYERALDDPSLIPGDDPGNPFLVAQLRAVSAHLQGLDDRMQGIEGRMASIEELLQARGGAFPWHKNVQWKHLLLLMTWIAELVGLTDACCAL